jgi:transketolase
MRRHFSELLHKEMSRNKDIILLTGDLGYGLWDKIRLDYSNRFYYVGSSEQLMLGMAAGAAMEGKIPIVYSITPFLLYRPFEFIRNYLDHEKLPVKLVGGGRDRDYGHLGFSHWAEDDKKIMSCFSNIRHHRPITSEQLETIFHYIVNTRSPEYINLKRKY